MGLQTARSKHARVRTLRLQLAMDDGAEAVVGETSAEPEPSPRARACGDYAAVILSAKSPSFLTEMDKSKWEKDGDHEQCQVCAKTWSLLRRRPGADVAAWVSLDNCVLPHCCNCMRFQN